MSRNPDPKPQRHERMARTEADKANQRTAAEQYAVGYPPRRKPKPPSALMHFVPRRRPEGQTCALLLP